ncbi:flagellar biosynthesis protein FliQ [Desulfoferrobacter suflitae]|uniref:flagellar biosynthesis protein FliQ n=1 Tax=Desulfoferrobacter suflitae TaxID=2865782 RepID=UPI002164707D|nr:flagellar biosynthesis protein FliQ [Desulfoferrobacter suflitae]
MTPEFVMGLARQSLETLLWVSLPVLLVSLLVGLVISVFQSVTQIQEMTLSFVPKIIVTFLALVVFGSWMMAKITDFTREILVNIPLWLK